MDFDVNPTNALPWQLDVNFSPIVEKFLTFSNYLPQFYISTIFLVNNGHRAIKVNVNEVQYCMFMFNVTHCIMIWLLNP